MASTHKSLRSGTANKRPTTSIADGQIALNTNTTSPGLFFKDSTGATIIKVGPVHVGTTAPNASPAAGGSAGNSVGEIWLDTSLTPVGVKIWNGSAFVNATPIGSTTVQGLLELATNAETQTGTDPDRAVTPAGLQSKVSDSTSTTSSTTIASSTAVKSAYDLANAALPKSGGTVTGNLEIGTTGSLSFEGATADAFETTIAVVDPTADRTITLPDTTGTVVTTGDTGTVTSTMIADGTIVNGDVNASAAIAGTKISPDFGSQTVQTIGIFSHALGTAAAPTVTFTGDTNTGIYSPGADQVAISTGGSGRLFVDSSGNIGVGASPVVAFAGQTHLTVNHSTGGTTVAGINLATDGTRRASLITYPSNSEALRITAESATLPITFYTNSNERMRLDSSGRLGVGTSSPDVKLHVAMGNGTGYIKLDGGTSSQATTGILFRANSDGYAAEVSSYQGNLQFITGVTERARIDSSGRLLVGTSTARNNFYNTTGTGPSFQIEGADNNPSSMSLICNFNGNTNGPALIFGKSNSTAIGSNVLTVDGNNLGRITFQGNDGSEFVQAGEIRCEVDGTPGANDMPGRLVFSTTADGASSPTERMRITNAGYLFVGKTNGDINSTGFQVYGPTGQTDVTVSGSECMNVNRNTNDGDLIRFRQDNNVEGSISVSGTTVSYNGAHLSRWSQLPSGAARTEILRGSVLSNIDEMCEWGDEANEQLNRMKVSDVEGDKNVSGVFQAWDDDDDTYTNDFYCAMTGDFIIRIGAGVTVERGDLLMSAGDGTAKPQDDDIIRSKTIAKVTSTHVTCTYDDGSYCVPCVLMAC